MCVHLALTSAQLSVENVQSKRSRENVTSGSGHGEFDCPFSLYVDLDKN